MAIVYPSSLDSFTNPAAGSLVTAPDHAQQHTDLNNLGTTIEGLLGTNSGTSVLKNFVAGNFAARTNNETFGTPTFILGGDAAGDIFYRSSSGTATNLAISSTQGRSLTVSTGTLPSWGGRGVFNAKSTQLTITGTATSASYVSIGSLALTAGDVPVPSILYVTAGICTIDKGGGNQTNPILYWNSIGGTVISQTAVGLEGANNGVYSASLVGVLSVPAGAGTIIAAINLQGGAGSIISSNNNSYISALIISQ